jgi:oxalate decarboxylase/phosphoglucose isomerase-like protein (cupin superfamily)
MGAERGNKRCIEVNFAIAKDSNSGTVQPWVDHSGMEFEVILQISRAQKAVSAYEYGCDLRRIYPWPGVADPAFWGAAIASVRPGEATSPHSHDEEETFLIMSGKGLITVDGERETVEAGDVIYLPRGSTHTLANASTEERLDFLTIFWGSPEARRAIREMIDRVDKLKGAASSCCVADPASIGRNAS